MSDVSGNLQKESKKKLEFKLKEIEKERERVVKLLEMTKPALESMSKRKRTEVVTDVPK